MKIERAFHLDDRGEVHLQSQSLPFHDDDGLEDELTAVKERGYVEWCVRSSHVSVRMRPSLVSPGAYSRLMGWLMQHRPRRVLLSSFVEQRWEYEYCREPGEAARRVRWLIELHGGGGYCNARRRRVSVLSARNPLGWKHAAAFWKEHRETNPQRARQLFDRFFLGRWTLYGCTSGRAFTVRSFGDNQSEHVRKWLETRRRSGLAEPSDRLFSQSCAPIFERVAASHEPRTDEMDVITDWTGYGRRRSQYRRLLLPFRCETGSWLLSGIEMDASIELLK